MLVLEQNHRAATRAVTGEEAAELLDLGRGRPLPTPLPLVHAAVAAWARTEPDRPAVWGEDRALSYGELASWADRVAADLLAAGVARGDRVAVLTRPTAATVAAVLGVLRAGAAYVPLDLAHPDRRVTTVLADAGVVAAVVDEAGRARLAATAPALPLVDTEGPTAPAAPVPEVPVTDRDLAYLIYTSGSTGEPKGVEVEHGQLAASTLARHLVYPDPAVFLLVSPLVFDSAVAGLWGTLTEGGRLVVAGRDAVRDPDQLLDLVEHHRVTRLLCVPSLYAHLLTAAARDGYGRLASLRTVVVAGEPLPPALVTRHFTAHGRVTRSDGHDGPARRCELVNEYGPTEGTVWASYRRFTTGGPVSIGGPVPGARLYVLDDEGRLVPRGAEGELYIGGALVARGYHGRPEATARAFTPDPFDRREGARMYRTGDRVRWNPDGTLAFLGRRDQQVKIRGHRVELGAVEAALAAVPGVEEAAVVPDEDHASLTGFVCARPGTTAEAVRRHLARTLPEVMVPARVRLLDSFPRTVNGKVDRARLAGVASSPATPNPAPDPAVPADAGTGRTDAAPTEPTRAAGVGTDRAPADDTDLVARVAAAWAEVLKTPADELPRDVNFFDLGGHSLTVFQLQQALERHTGTRPAVVSLFRHTTVAAQAELVRDTPADAGVPDAAQAARQAAARRARAARERRVIARRTAHQEGA